MRKQVTAGYIMQGEQSRGLPVGTVEGEAVGSADGAAVGAAVGTAVGDPADRNTIREASAQR